MSSPGRKFSPLKLVLLALLVAGGVAWWFTRGRDDLQFLHGWALELPALGVFFALVFLPLVGFPVSILHAVTGARFGLGLGLALVGVSIAIQLVLSYAIVRLAPHYFARRFAWLRERLPPATHRSLTIFTMLLPGAPYVAQNYVLPVVNVPFVTYFWYGLILHFVRSIVGVIFGEWSGDMTPGRTAAFVVYSVLITVACALALRQLRARLRNPPPGAGGRTQPA